MLKTIKGFDNVDFNKSFKLSDSRLRGHSLKLFMSWLLIRLQEVCIWFQMC